MSLVIGLTGGIASGKSTSANYIKSKGYKVIDCDKIAHDVLLLESTITKLVEEFGECILIDNKIDRASLGNVVFNDKDKLNTLNNILHPLVYCEVKKEITNDIVFIDCPLLFETNFINLCDKTLVIYVDLDTQVKRLIKRNNLTEKEALKRIELQMSLDIKKSKSDYSIDNTTSIECLQSDIDKFLNTL